MGACAFQNFGSGETAERAFWNVVDEAQCRHGHGYTGTIAEKYEFVMIPLVVPDDLNEARRLASQHAEKLIAEDDPRIDDKWGPAGCIALGHNHYLFFGWASS